MRHVQKFLIVGSTGYTGQAVVKELRRRNISTVAHIRPNSPHKETFHPTFSNLGATIDHTAWEQEAMVDMLTKHQPTHVFSLLGTTKAKARAASKQGEDATYESVDRDLSILLLQAMSEAQTKRPDHVFRYLFLSSMGVQSQSTNRYLRARADVEAHIQKTNFSWLIARPSFISGPDRQEHRPMERIGSIFGDALLGALAVLGVKRPYQQYGTLSAAELALGLVELSLDEHVQQQILETKDIRLRL